MKALYALVFVTGCGSVAPSPEAGSVAEGFKAPGSLCRVSICTNGAKADVLAASGEMFIPEIGGSDSNVCQVECPIISATPPTVASIDVTVHILTDPAPNDRAIRCWLGGGNATAMTEITDMPADGETHHLELRPAKPADADYGAITCQLPIYSGITGYRWK